MQSKNTLGRRIAVIVLTVLTAVYCTALPSFAQSAVGTNGEITELVVGRNNKGPYTLSWTEIDARSVSVMLESRTLKKGSDFNIDTAKGIIAFDRVLVTDAIVRVTYKLTPGKSKANNGSMDVPVSLNLVSRQDASLSVTGLYAQGDPNKPDSAKTIVGLGGSKIMGGTKLNSQFMVSQRNDDSKANDQANTWEKSVVKFGTETKMGGLTLTSNFSHAGMAFGGAKEYKTDLGKEAMDVAMLYSSGQTLQTAFKFKKTDDTAASAKGTYSEIMEQAVNLSPIAGTNLSFSHSNTETGTKTGMGKILDSSTVKINQMVGRDTTALAAVQTVKTTTGNKVDESQVRTISMASKAIEGLNLEASLVDKTTSGAGQEQLMSASVASDATKKISFNAAVNSGDSQKGRSSSNNYGVRFADKVMQLQMTSTQSSQVGKEQYQRGVTFASAFAGNGKVTADYNLKGLNDKQDTTYGAGLELSPITGMGLSISHRDSSFANSAKTMATDFVKIAQRFGGATSATLSMESTDVVEGSKTDQINVRQMALTTTAIPGITVQASNSETTSSAGSATKTAASLGVKAPVGVEMAISATQEKSVKNEESNKLTAGMKVALKGVPVVIQGSGTQSQSGKGDPERNLNAAIAVDPFKALSIKAEHTSAQTQKNGINEKSNVSMMLKSGLGQLSASMSGTVSGSTQSPKEQYRREVSLTSKPFAFAKFIAQFTQNGVNENDDVMKTAMLELAPFSNTRLRTGFKYVETGANVLTIYDYGAETNPWGFISLSGSFRDRQSETTVAPDTTSVKLALKPVSSFSVTGEYLENPEDAKTGVVQPFNSTGLGLNWRIGSVGLLANSMSKDEYVANKTSDERKLGVEIDAFGGGKLTTGVKLARMFSGSELMTRTYSMGFKQNIGSDFSLSLSGYYSESLKDRMILDDQRDVGAEIKFSTKM